MKKLVVAIGLIVMTAIIATSGIAIETVRGGGGGAEGGNGGDGPPSQCPRLPSGECIPNLPDTVNIKRAAGEATGNSLRQTSQQITSNPILSGLAKNTISQKLNDYADLVTEGCNGTFLPKLCPH